MGISTCLYLTRVFVEWTVMKNCNTLNYSLEGFRNGDEQEITYKMLESVKSVMTEFQTEEDL